MKKILLVGLIAVAVTGCATNTNQLSNTVGNWTKVSESANEIYYVDSMTVRQTSFRYAKTIQVSKTNHVKGIGRWVDCASSPFRSKWSIADTAVFENGKAVKVDVVNVGKWTVDAPGSVEEQINKFICSAPPNNTSNHRQYADFHGITQQNAQNNTEDSFAKRFFAALIPKPPVEQAKENCQGMGFQLGTNAYQQCLVSETNSIREARARVAAAHASSPTVNVHQTTIEQPVQSRQPRGYTCYNRIGGRIECSAY